ncbi:MAG: hypothetical protein LBQ88_21260 [Treponema sp.]|nr:hypothetical protein [Treponema sp.]
MPQVSLPLLTGKRGLSLIFRSAALCIILYQFRLLANDLADTPVFMVNLLAAFVIPLFIVKISLHPFSAVLVIALIPWCVRLFIAFPRYFISGIALELDSLLLNIDRNNFVSLLPYYWASVSTFFSLRSRKFLRADIIASDMLLLTLFSITSTANMEAYRWPILMIGIFTAVLFLQLISVILSIPPELRLRKTECATAAVSVLLLVILGGVLFIRPSQERAVDRGGGLLEPKLFQFDFSQVLKLESEISMNDDLVLIVKKDSDDEHILLRRYVLSGYNKKQGFFRVETWDEAAHPGKLPERKTSLDAKPISSGRITNQEYYIVNFDGSAFIGMNAPLSVTPFETWDASSFRSAYAVESLTSEAIPIDLIRIVQEEPGPESLGLSPEEYALYTEYNYDKEIEALAREITEGMDNYWEKVQAIYEYLKFGDYYYSLKPGIAADGDQLKFFLFESKKGYCSYYAFAFTLLVRSLGIPARVAAGFFLDPATNTFDYYPVRGDMAHAWVEVYYPEYGWIEYDPTTQQFADGEEFRFSSGVPQELFERLMKEILENHSRLKEKEGSEEEGNPNILQSLQRGAILLIRRIWLPFIIIVICLLFALFRTGYLILAGISSDPRKKSRCLWRHTLRRFNLAGYKRDALLSEAEWAKKMDAECHIKTYQLYKLYAAARFAPEYRTRDWAVMQEEYHAFSKVYKEKIPAWRRFLAWALPPLAVTMGPSKPGALDGGPRKPDNLIRGIVLLFITGMILSLAGETAGAQTQTPDADTLYYAAEEAQNAEFWERAIELYTQGGKLFPYDARFPWALGRLYFYRELYHLAWDEYRKTEVLVPDNTGLLYELSQTAGHLNENHVSAAYLEKILAIDPDNRDAIGNLGWMYYKIHRLNDGERLLLSAIERFGVDSDFSMTLGTVYADMFDYNEGKKWYLSAINDAELVNDKTFAAVAHYNLSILESRFYQYDLALKETRASLSSLNRASGRLALGELYVRQLEIAAGIAEYQQAYEMDTSPLSKVNLAQTYQTAGRLEEARLYAEECLRAGDLSWMLNYGIDPVRYRRDIHSILYQTYEGLEKTEALTPYVTFEEKVRSLGRRIRCRFKASVHRQLYRKYSLESADAYAAENNMDGQHLDALIQYYNAFEAYPRRALSYLNKARAIEVPLIPQSEASYDLEEGKLTQDADLLRQAVYQFEPVWERDVIAEAYTELAQDAMRRGRKAEFYAIAERLFALNRGALRQAGIRLPIKLEIGFSEAAGGGGSRGRTERRIRKAVAQAGFEPVSGNSSLFGALFGGTVWEPRFRLTISLSGQEARCELYDGNRGIDLVRRNIPLTSLSRTDLSAFVRNLSNEVLINTR